MVLTIRPSDTKMSKAIPLKQTTPITITYSSSLSFSKLVTGSVPKYKCTLRYGFIRMASTVALITNGVYFDDIKWHVLVLMSVDF